MARYYTIVDKLSGEVKQTYMWTDDRDFPENILIEEGCELQETKDEAVDYNYHTDLKGNFFILDIPDNELEAARIKAELSNYEDILSDFQEATWTAMGIDETKLPQIWQDRLAEKRRLRALLEQYSSTI